VAGLDPQPSSACGAAHILLLRMLGWEKRDGRIQINTWVLLKRLQFMFHSRNPKKPGCGHAFARQLRVKDSELKNFLLA
jgi:hypothetical protein